MTAKKQPAKRVKAGTSKSSAEDKKHLFVEAYLSNGGNATDAALQAGYSKSGASKQGYRMSKDPVILSMIDTRRTYLVAKVELDTERLFKGIACIAFSDPRRIMHPDGRIKMPNELDDDTAAAIASFEVSFDGSIKYKFWDKNNSHERAGKILGVFERDNKQKTDPLRDLLGALSGNVLGVTNRVDPDCEEE